MASSVKTLSAPVSDGRLFSTKEKILLLKGSKVHRDYKFPPWTVDPTGEEFLGPAFYDTFDFTFSRAQLDHLAGWSKPSVTGEAWRRSLGDVTNDCSIVASLCAAGSRAIKLGCSHEVLFSSVIFPMSNPSKNGKYVLKLNFNGCFRRVVIDDFLPISKSEQCLHVKGRKNPYAIWPALIEKAYLKVTGGYDFPGSNSGTDLWVLLGWIPEQVCLKE